jgi:hypothetical protein
MRRIHALAVSLLLAGGAVLGALAATRTVQLGAKVSQAKPVPDAVVKRRARKLDAFERSLKHTLARKPGSLPVVPKFKPVQMPSVPAVPTFTPVAPRVTPVSEVVAARPAVPRKPTQRPVKYVRPPPVTRYVRPAPVQGSHTKKTDEQKERERAEREAAHEQARAQREAAKAERERAKLEQACQKALDRLAEEQAKPDHGDKAHKVAEAQAKADEKCQAAREAP